MGREWNLFSNLFNCHPISGCRDELHSAMLTAAFEARPNERMTVQLARMFYNMDLLNPTNYDRLESLKTTRLCCFDLDGNELEDGDQLIENGTCLDAFLRQCQDIRDADLRFHIEGNNSENYVTHFSRTKFKKYECNNEFLTFMAAQVHLLFANMPAKPSSLMQSSTEVLLRFEEMSRENQNQFLVPLFAREENTPKTPQKQKEKEMIKERLRDALETSTSPRRPFMGESRHRSSSTNNINQPLSYRKMKKRSNSLDSLQRSSTSAFKSNPLKSLNRATKGIKTVVVGNEISTLRSFIASPRKPPIHSKAGQETQSTEVQSFSAADLADLFEFSANTELYRLVATPGGKELLEKPVRAILQWIEFDRIAATNCTIHDDEPIEVVKMNQMHLVIALLLHDFRTTRALEKQILSANEVQNVNMAEAMETIQSTIKCPNKTVTDERKNDEFIEKFHNLEHQSEPVVKQFSIEELPKMETIVEPPKIADPIPEVESNNKPAEQEQVKLPQMDTINPQMLMAQQMTLLTQMMSLMQQNMMNQQQPVLREQIETRNPMYRRSISHDPNLRQISPRKVKEETNKALMRIHGLPLLDLALNRTHKRPVPKHKIKKENIFQRSTSVPNPNKGPNKPSDKPFKLITLHQEDPEPGKQNKSKFQLLEFQKVANFVSVKKQNETDGRKRLLLQNAQPTDNRRVQPPVTLPKRDTMAKKLKIQENEIIDEGESSKSETKEQKRPEMVLIDYGVIGNEIRKQVDEAHRNIEALTIDELRKRAKQSVTTSPYVGIEKSIDETIEVRPPKSSSNSPSRLPSKSSPKISNSTSENAKSLIIEKSKSISFTDEPTEQISLDDDEAERQPKTKSVKSELISVSDLEREIEDEIDARSNNDIPSYHIDLQELDSLQQDIAEMSPKTRKTDFDSAIYTTRSKASILANGLNSARRRDNLLKTNSQIRDEEAIKLATEALSDTKLKRKKSSTKKSSKSSLKKNSSIERVYLNTSLSRSHSAPPQKKSSITIHPYRRAPSDTRQQDTPKWRSLTRMEAYTGRGLYSERGARKAPSNVKLQPGEEMPPMASNARTFTHVDIAPPRVRTVEEILEQTKVSLSHIPISERAPSEFEVSRDDSAAPPPYHPIRRSYSLESGLSSLSAMNSLLNEIDADHLKYIPSYSQPVDGSQSDDLIGEINNLLNP